MTWSAPPAARTEAPYVADERAMLESWLDFHRQTLLDKCAGLSSSQLKLRSVEPSALSLLGLVRHMADVERSWFRQRFGGEPIDSLYWSDADPDGDFDNVDTADAEADLAAFHREIEAAREIAASRSLEETYRDPLRETEMSLRWIYVHMIEEYARHNGHADLIRERLDGVTGA